MTAGKKSMNEYQNLHKSMKLITVIANILGLLPINGVTSDSAESLNLKWFSLKIVYTFIIILLAVFGNVMYLFSLLTIGFSYTLIRK